MKTVGLVFLIVIFFFGGITVIIGQDEQSSADLKKQDKADRKKQKEEKELAEWNESLDLANSQRFVFNASHLYTSEGSVGLNPKINFFYVQDNYSVIQFGFEGVYVGGNGVGGVTTEGIVDKYVVKGDKPKKPVMVEMTLRPAAGQGIGIYNIVIKFFGDGYGEVLLNSSGLRLQGQITTHEKAHIHEGNKL